MTDHEWRTAASEPVSRVTRSRQRPQAAGAHRSQARAGMPPLRGVRKRAKVLVLAVTALTVVGGIATAAVLPAGTNGPGLAAVGPVSATDGFPVWYKDKSTPAGLRLENCISLTDPMCPAIGAVDRTAPISFPGNYPDEGFYSLASAQIAPTNGVTARLDLNLEQAFRTGKVVDGDQITFSRLRVKITNVKDNQDYIITTPGGVKTLQTNGKTAGLIFDTEDVGIGGVGDFSGALGGRIGPFLTWDTFGKDPALKPDAAGNDTYIGDGVTPHKITGSPYGTNIFRIEGPGINPTPAVDACPTVAGDPANCIETDLFTIQGKLATTSGVTAEQATYSRSAAGAGNVDVYASSETGPQAIQVSDAVTAAPEFDTTGLVGSNGRYFARVAYKGDQPPAKVQVSNTGDVPVSTKVIDVVDRVTGSATYDTDSKLLTVQAVSSDTAVPRTLTATGFGALAAGTYVSDPIDAPPVSVTVTSDAKGSVVLPVEITGSGQAPIPVVAQAGPDQTVSVGQLVTLDGSASAPAAQSFSWTSVPAGITLAKANTANPTFTPTSTGTFTFSLSVTGPGGPSTATVTVTVVPVSAAKADAGPDQTGVKRGTKVTLNGAGSTGAASYSWSQVAAPGDPTVSLTGSTTAQPTFTFPLYKSPANNGPLTFKLDVTSVDGSTSNDTVTIAPSADVVTITKALYTASKKEWRIDGTSSVPAGGQTVIVHLGALSGTTIGTSLPVDATGAWSVRVTSALVGANGQTVSAESQLGGTLAGVAVRVQ